MLCKYTVHVCVDSMYGESPFVEGYHVVVRSLLTRCVSSAQNRFDYQLIDLAAEHHVQIF